MKLLNNLYTVTNCNRTDADIKYGLKLDAEHFIYKAHFPGHPITPGVCIVQITKELLEDYFEAALDVVKVKNVKFLSIIDPTQTAEVEYTLKKIEERTDDGLISAQAVVSGGGVTLAKISLICTKR